MPSVAARSLRVAAHVARGLRGQGHRDAMYRTLPPRGPGAAPPSACRHSHPSAGDGEPAQTLRRSSVAMTLDRYRHILEGLDADPATGWKACAPERRRFLRLLQPER